MLKKIDDLIYDFMEVQPHDVEPSDKRVWQIVYVYRKGRLIAEGRAACCLADMKDKLFNVEQGYEIATGRARIAIENKRSYGRLPEGFYKGAYYGQENKDLLPFGLVSMALVGGMFHPKFCPSCGKSLSTLRPPIESLITSNMEGFKKAVRKCANVKRKREGNKHE